MTRNAMLSRCVWTAACVVATFGLAAPAAAQVDFGVRGGAFLEDKDPFVGVELLTRMGASDWYFNPNLEFVFADERDRIGANLDFHYDFDVAGVDFAWAGAGLAVIRSDGARGRGDETDAGLNLLGGVGWKVQGTTPYAQLKVVLSDDSELVAAVGIRF